ncbi:MAG: DUF5110 domain-containing protein [candidate division KSB1 bacterium]|nr:DUF5110 domain-containing protein [candidate division KSB1 bacterium]
MFDQRYDNYNYEKGAYSTITFNWNDSKNVLTIYKRKGSFPGMLDERMFNIVVVNKNKGAGMATSVGKTILYSGEEMKSNLK